MTRRGFKERVGEKRQEAAAAEESAQRTSELAEQRVLEQQQEEKEEFLRAEVRAKREEAERNEREIRGFQKEYPEIYEALEVLFFELNQLRFTKSVKYSIGDRLKTSSEDYSKTFPISGVIANIIFSTLTVTSPLDDRKEGHEVRDPTNEDFEDSLTINDGQIELDLGKYDYYSSIEAEPGSYYDQHGSADSCCNVIITESGFNINYVGSRVNPDRYDKEIERSAECASQEELLDFIAELLV